MKASTYRHYQGGNTRRVPRLVTLRTAIKADQHLAMAAEVVAGALEVRRGSGSTREEAIAAAVRRGRIYYANLGIERDVCVAEGRGHEVRLAVSGEYLHDLPFDFQ